MELDDFKSAWQTLNQKVDQQTALNLTLLRASRMKKARHGLRPLVWGQALQMLLGALLALASGSFWVDHRQVPYLLATGLLMHAYGLAMILFGARMQVLIHRIDFGSPVLNIQKQLKQLRRFHVISGLCLGLPWWLLWIPFLSMVCMGVFGVDLAAKVPAMARLQYAVGLAGVALTVVFILWARRRPALAGPLERTAAGRSLNELQRELEEIDRFEQPDTQA